MEWIKPRPARRRTSEIRTGREGSGRCGGGAVGRRSHAYPDSATTWETINSNDGTVVYYHDKTPEVAAAGGGTAQLYVLPLISGATPQLAANKAASLPVLNDLDAPGIPANAFDLNHARFSGDIQGWIGAPPSAVTRPPFRGQWIELKDSDNKVTSRYAYWMEERKLQSERKSSW